MNNNLPAVQPEEPVPDIQPEWLNQFVRNQAQELEIRKEQTAIQKLQAQQNFEFSKAALAAQGEDRKHIRDSTRIIQRDRYYLIFAIIFLLALFLAYAMYLNKDQIALEVIKYATAVGISAYGGYSVGKNQGKKEASNNAPFPRKPNVTPQPPEQ